MRIECIWEHNGDDTLLYAKDWVGAYTRGESLDVALQKMKDEIQSYATWCGKEIPKEIEPVIVQEKDSELEIKDADSDVIFEAEEAALTMEEYTTLRDLALKSAADFLTLYESVPDKNASALPIRKTFYGQVPRTAEEMYLHTKNVNSYYFAEIGVDADNEGTIYDCRMRGFEQLERQPEFLSGLLQEGSYGEMWSLRKVLRRFIWHDRIHAKAMKRMIKATFGEGAMQIIVPEMKDIKACANAYIEAYAAQPWEERYEQSEVENYLSDYLNSDVKRCYALIENGEIKGVALGFVVPSIAGTYFRVEDFCVDASVQRKGYGSRFMELLTEEVAKVGCDSVILGTQRDYPSHHFYLKNGFQEVESVLLYKELK